MKIRLRYFLIICCAISLYALSAGIFSILRFKAFNAGYIDLGRMEQALWSIANGNLIVNTFQYGNAPRLIAHFEGIFFLLAPLYSLFQRTEFLLILQSVILGASALPLYLIARRELKSQPASLIIALSYLAYPTIFYINMKDFHPDCLAIFFIFSSFYFMLKKNWKWFWVFIVLLTITREYCGLISAFLGIYMLHEYHDTRRSGILIALGLGAFLVTFLILPRMFTQFYLWHDKVGPIPGSVFRSDGLLRNIAALFIPLGFLPLLKIKRILISLPIAGAAILLGKFSYANHHAALLVPFIFLSTVDVLKGWDKKKVQYALWIIVIASLFANQLYGASPISARFYLPGDFHYYKAPHRFQVTEHDKLLDEFVKMIPDEASVTASNHIGSHLARREYINFFPFPDDLNSVRYVLVDLKEPPNNAHWLKWSRQVELVRGLVSNPRFQLLRKEDEVYLFERK